MTINETFQAGLVITAIGMGLVFAAIILLWGLMTLMVRIGSKLENPKTNGILAEEPAIKPGIEDSGKHIAAVVALAVALSLHNRVIMRPPPISGSTGTAWQDIHRAQAVNEKSTLFSGRQNRRL
jgi:Na+-transporting methylmalonyl-CoA/oxaloacetate decarboxylase gamma subunit